MDQCFEFNTFMTDRIAMLQTQLAGKYGWDFIKDKDEDITVDQQVGYVAYLANLLRSELFQVRTLLLEFHLQSEFCESDLRKCPHCGLIWYKFEGCDGMTTCG